MQATFDADGIVFAEYPFPAASIYPNRRLTYSAIRDVDPDATPPEVRTNDGETLFISAEQASDFRTAIAKYGLTVVRRVDVWGLLLEPFLDTEFTTDDDKRTMAALQRLGLTQSEVSQTRRSVRNAMLTHNGLHWDHVHLGLYDVLTATRWPVTGTGFINLLFPKRFDQFYWHAMTLADRGRSGSAAIEPNGQPEPLVTRCPKA